jgi:signal transduction histidine kinase
VRNALVHGRPAGGAPPHVVVTVDGHTVTIDDDGSGVPAEERERVVQRFVKGAGSGGSGLGLAIAREVTVAHGGAVEVGVSPLGGARVTLAFAG